MSGPRNYDSQHPLALWRRGKGLTQRELADLLGVSMRTVQAIEIGRLPLSTRTEARWAAVKADGHQPRLRMLVVFERRVESFRRTLYTNAGIEPPSATEHLLVRREMAKLAGKPRARRRT